MVLVVVVVVVVKNTAVAEATSMDFIMPCYKQLECYKYHKYKNNNKPNNFWIYKEWNIKIWFDLSFVSQL